MEAHLHGQMAPFNPSADVLAGRRSSGSRGRGLAAPAQQSFTVEEPNCRRHLQTPRNWQLSTTFPWAGLEECITHMKIMLEAQTKGFSKTSPEVWICKWSLSFFFFYTPPQASLGICLAIKTLTGMCLKSLKGAQSQKPQVRDYVE